MRVTFSISLPTPVQNCIYLFLTLNNPILLYFQFLFPHLVLTFAGLRWPVDRNSSPNLSNLLLPVLDDQITKFSGIPFKLQLKGLDQVWGYYTMNTIKKWNRHVYKKQPGPAIKCTGSDKDASPGRPWANHLASLSFTVSSVKWA